MSDERRDRILNATAALLLKFGYNKMTVSDIAAEAGISKGAIYLHFPSKEAVVEALIWREAEWAEAEIMRRLEADPQGGSWLSLFVHSLRVAMERPLLRAFYSGRKKVYGDVLHVLMPKFANTQIRQLAVEFIAKYQELGLIRPELDPKVVAFTQGAIRYGLLTIDDIVPPEEIPDLDDVLALLAEILHRGLSAEGGDMAAGRQQFAAFVHDAIERGKSGASPEEERS